ncbi:single-stranded DNA-binding protein [Urbifossiella limnaea]|uniref:Single-stranded DNA-binding protein n=1 Tax=Urbifossiella limnaea TaxID=2528023 RepID=A0A517XM91_9BACT|nr:single-stranded DNA-binding protein [Urbifossiella limnaea]QDU18625.1 Single-stranded DNA-binding protein [Urbifossiella limnaea]
MATLNKVMLIGRLTDNPGEVRTMPNGGRVIPFRFAVGRSRKNPQTGQWENDPNPLYIDCEAFSRPDTKRDLVNLIQQFCKKGDPLYIEGRLQYDQWEDKNGGGKRSKHKVVVNEIEFLGGNRDGGDGGGEMGGGGRVAQSGGGGNRGGYSGGGGGRPAQNTGGNRGGYSAPPPDDDNDYGGTRGGGTSGGGDEDIPF